MSRFYVIEYLSTGIYEVEGEPVGELLKTTRCARGLHHQGFRKPHWYASLDDAVAFAAKLRERQLHKALQQVKRLAMSGAVKVKLLPTKKTKQQKREGDSV